MMHESLTQRLDLLPRGLLRQRLGEIFEIIWSRSQRGFEMDRRNGLRIGRIDSVDENPRWIHKIAYSSSEGQIKELEEKLGFLLPADAKHYFISLNGASLFRAQSVGYHLGLSGIVNHGEQYDNSVVSPTQIEMENVYSILPELPIGALRFGRYAWDGSHVCMDDQGRIYLRDEKSDSHIMEWPSLGDYLLAEVSRLDALLGPDGIGLSEEIPTAPHCLLH